MKRRFVERDIVHEPVVVENQRIGWIAPLATLLPIAPLPGLWWARDPIGMFLARDGVRRVFASREDAIAALVAALAERHLAARIRWTP